MNMHYKRKRAFGEGLIFALLLLLCISAMLIVHLNAKPKVETLYAIHALPDDFAKININLATAEELQSLPGIGEALSNRIVEYREANGAFQSIDEIMRVNGIGESVFAKIENSITVGSSCE